MDYVKLLDTCCSTEVNVTTEMAEAVEKATRDQSGSSLWFKYRAGRITASRMKATCHSDPINPAQSLFVILKHLNSAMRQHRGDVNIRNLQGIHMRAKWFANTMALK